MLDPRTGEVLALASTPTFDASAITDPATAEATFEALLDDPAEPLLPRATLGRYVPGSVFKIVTAVAGLGSGAVSPSTTYKEQPAAEKDGLLVDGFRIQDGHHPETGAPALDLDRRDRGVMQHLVRADRSGDRRADLVEYAERMGFDDAAALRPADRRLPGHRRRAAPAGRVRRRRGAGERRVRPG